jgi:hypothetical protein
VNPRVFCPYFLPAGFLGKKCYTVAMNKDFQCLSWQEVKSDFFRLNKELAEIIDEINPPDDFRLYKAQYPYGSIYIQNGHLHLPDGQSGLTRLDNPSVPKQIQDDLYYQHGTYPVAFVLDKIVELFLPFPHRETPAPFIYATPGTVMSTLSVLGKNTFAHHPHFLWNFSAGARSILMLPKISKVKNYQRIQRKYGLPIKPPQKTTDHWELFRNLYQKDLLGEWNLSIIFFSKQWFEHIETKPYQRLREYLKRQIHKTLSFSTNLQFWNAYFSILHNTAGIRPSAYAYDTAKHLLLLSMGVLPGMAPIISDEAAPIKAIQQLFLEEYKIEDYLPIILALSRFDPFKACPPIYYSLHYPNALELALKPTEHSSTILELYEIKNLLNLYLRSLQSEELNVSQTVLSEIPGLVNFEFFHSDPGNYRDIKNSEILLESDPLFSSTSYDFKSKKPRMQPTSASFIRGCVKISHKNDKEDENL